MSTPLALGAIGTILSYGDGASPEGFTVITNRSSLTGLSMSAAVVDVTNNNSSVAWRQKVVTLLDAGTLQFDLYFIPSDTGQKKILNFFTIRGQATAQTPIDFKLVFADAGATTWLFSGFFSKFNMTAAVAEVIKVQAEIVVTGAPTFPA